MTKTFPNEDFVLTALNEHIKSELEQIILDLDEKFADELKTRIRARVGEMALNILREYRVYRREDVLVIEVKLP